ncbi:3-keto-5-aminohexanoate cleavage protein, partial [Vibrio parahaemolyticus]
DCFVIVQACLNGARAVGFHPALPVTAAALARDGAACVAAGAAALHVHPRGAGACESLAPAVVDAAVAAMRAACPGAELGVSTGEWIEGD